MAETYGQEVKATLIYDVNANPRSGIEVLIFITVEARGRRIKGLG